jgi:very-short-patch-repair endonuclease
MGDDAREIFNRKHLEKSRKELRNLGTAAEAVLWKYLQKRQILGKKFRRQASIGPYIVDFFCPECRLIIELDGAVHDGFLPGEYDAERTTYLEQLGLKVLRSENRILYDNPDAVLDTIKQALCIP